MYSILDHLPHPHITPAVNRCRELTLQVRSFRLPVSRELRELAKGFSRQPGRSFGLSGSGRILAIILHMLINNHELSPISQRPASRGDPRWIPSTTKTPEAHNLQCSTIAPT